MRGLIIILSLYIIYKEFFFIFFPKKVPFFLYIIYIYINIKKLLLLLLLLLLILYHYPPLSLASPPSQLTPPPQPPLNSLFESPFPQLNYVFPYKLHNGPSQYLVIQSTPPFGTVTSAAQAEFSEIFNYFTPYFSTLPRFRFNFVASQLPSLVSNAQVYLDPPSDNQWLSKEILDSKTFLKNFRFATKNLPKRENFINPSAPLLNICDIFLT